MGIVVFGWKLNGSYGSEGEGCMSIGEKLCEIIV